MDYWYIRECMRNIFDNNIKLECEYKDGKEIITLNYIDAFDILMQFIQVITKPLVTTGTSTQTITVNWEE